MKYLKYFRGHGSTFKVVGPHNIVTKEAAPWLTRTGQENFLKINPSRLAKTSLFRLGFSKNLSQKMNSLQRNNSLFHNT